MEVAEGLEVPEADRFDFHGKAFSTLRRRVFILAARCLSRSAQM
jgi:hypothetical protein